MHLENVVLDAVDPRRVGRFWEAALGTRELTDEPAGYETRLDAGGGCELDLCFPQVPALPGTPPRLRLVLRGGGDAVARLRALGASAPDPGDPTVLADPAGTAFRVLDGDGPAELTLESADPDRDAAFWAWLTGWQPVDGTGASGTGTVLGHPSGHGPVLAVRPEAAPKGPGKNAVHLDVRLGPDDDADAVVAEVVARGGAELQPGWGDLPWRVLTDPSGNELCLLPPSRG